MVRLTSNSSRTTTTSVVIHNQRIALDDTIDREVTSVTSVGDLTVFEALDCDLNGVDS